MTRMLMVDPGKNTGIALAYYDPTTPFQLLERWQVHGGVDGFIAWWENERPDFDEFVCERFDLADNDFAADLTPVHIEGALRVLYPGFILWQPRTDKGRLTAYPATAATKPQRERVRNLWLDRYGLFAKGEDNQDSNDAIVHGLVNLKARRHMPTLRAYWGPKRPAVAA